MTHGHGGGYDKDCADCQYNDAISSIDRPEREESSASACHIATAAYGDPMAPEVVKMRTWGEDVLRKNFFGRAFIVAYDRFSPPFARWLRRTPWAAARVRALLDKLVRRL